MKASGRARLNSFIREGNEIIRGVGRETGGAKDGCRVCPSRLHAMRGAFRLLSTLRAVLGNMVLRVQLRTLARTRGRRVTLQKPKHFFEKSGEGAISSRFPRGPIQSIQPMLWIL